MQFQKIVYHFNFHICLLIVSKMTSSPSFSSHLTHLSSYSTKYVKLPRRSCVETFYKITALFK